ncbi:DUF3048 domain-containing protein [Salibacterium salarium]|uniref:DUF3048 domain-containing protein n=1 Tax=Salibacterium salarium TaxID=284579 RepID=A0A3R9QN10_9BACI|nr:DUF3048 domain-containing protein [Salibacterium salarium]RSL33883.1 DUF3048 domain-containing protein [Salibacterium salarium]
MKKLALISCSLCVFWLSACSGGEENTSSSTESEETVEESKEAQAESETLPEQDDSEETEESTETEEPEYDDTEPLTGEGTNDISPYRPMAVMVNNHPLARPQTGLSDADIVYEVLTEGDTTRFLAVFQSEQPDEIGPVRSSRGYFIDLAEGYDSLYVTHGWSPEAKQMLRSGSVPFLNGLFHDGTLFKRSTERQAPHDSYISFDDAMEGLTNKGYEVEREVNGNSFEEGGFSSAASSQADEVDIWYRDKYVVQFTYDEDDQVYERSSDNEETIDKSTNEQVAVKNVFVVEAPHRVVDDKGRRQINLSTGGEGLLLQNGEALTVQWKNEGGRLLPMKDGEEIPFAPGKTWINVVPSSSGITGSVQGIE